MWFYKNFEELKLIELEQILRLRQSIFIVEQQSHFADIDGKDEHAIHIFNSKNNVIWAYCRLLLYEDKIILGRVTILENMRGNGSGRTLLDTALTYIKQNFPGKDVEILAMSYLSEFYKSLGFTPTSEPYMSDGYLHEDMLLKYKH